jgi:hypothetical protein
MSGKRWSQMANDERLREWLHERRNFDNHVNRIDPGTFEEYSHTRSTEDAALAHVEGVHNLLRQSVGKSVQLTMSDGRHLSGVLEAEGAHALFLRMAGQPRPTQINADAVKDVQRG